MLMCQFWCDIPRIPDGESDVIVVIDKYYHFSYCQNRIDTKGSLRNWT